MIHHTWTHEWLYLVVIRCNDVGGRSCSDTMDLRVGHGEVVVNSFGS